jgi:hypothetical protein
MSTSPVYLLRGTGTLVHEIARERRPNGNSRYRTLDGTHEGTCKSSDLVLVEDARSIIPPGGRRISCKFKAGLELTELRVLGAADIVAEMARDCYYEVKGGSDPAALLTGPRMIKVTVEVIDTREQPKEQA